MIKKCAASLVVFLLAISMFDAIARQNQKPDLNSVKSKLIPVSSFKHIDIGNPSIKGTVKILNSGFDVIASGADIWGVKDEFTFIYVERTGDFDIISRIESLMAANLYTKAGIMARENLTAGCRHVYFQAFSDNNMRNKNNGGYEFQYRQMKDSLMKAIYPKSFTGNPEYPVSFPNTWIRLKRTKNDFTGYTSTDGKTWKAYTTFTLDLPASVYLGLALTSHNNSHAASAKFRNTAELNPWNK